MILISKRVPRFGRALLPGLKPGRTEFLLLGREWLPRSLNG
jgi:hypothetical protein